MREQQCKPPRPPLRTSCDACHQSKVKCVSKSSATSCVRCEIRRTPCKRSSHLPFGRTPKNGRKRSTSTEAGLGAFDTNRMSQSPTLGERTSEGVEDAARFDDSSSPSEQPSQSLSPSDLHLGWELLFADTASSMLDSAVTLAPYEEMIFANLDPLSTATKYSESPPTSASTDNSTAPCACASSLIRASSDLKHLFCSGSDARADTVFRRARDLLAPVRAFMACHCGSDPSILLLAYLLVQKTLLLYRDAWACGSLSASNAELPPVRLGAYVVVKEDVDAVYSALLIHALSRVRSLLEALVEKTKEGCGGEREARAWLVWSDVMKGEIGKAVGDVREAGLQEDLKTFSFRSPVSFDDLLIL